MDSVQNHVSAEGFKKIRFTISRTNHLIVSGAINGVKGNFILDTGASNTCIGFHDVEYFKMDTAHSKTKAAGAGAIDMLTHDSSGNEIRLGRWKKKDSSIVVFDLTHVNQALGQYKMKTVHGIIGADILISGKAIIDYGQNFLYLKQE